MWLPLVGSQTTVCHYSSAFYYTLVFFSQYKTYKITDANSQTLPFVLNDVMGLENHEEDGVDPRDIIHALHGHVKEDYKVEKEWTYFNSS